MRQCTRNVYVQVSSFRGYLVARSVRLVRSRTNHRATLLQRISLADFIRLIRPSRYLLVRNYGRGNASRNPCKTENLCRHSDLVPIFIHFSSIARFFPRVSVALNARLNVYEYLDFSNCRKYSTVARESIRALVRVFNRELNYENLNIWEFR